VQEKGRSEILRDYHLRVGQLTQDTRIPQGHEIKEQRLDETQVGEGTTITFIDAPWLATSCDSLNAAEAARHLGLKPNAKGLVSWDVYESVLTPGDLILMIVWKTSADADAFAQSLMFPPRGRLRNVRVVRDYGMYDRREAPQYYPDATGRNTLHQ
jgi:hypothetical protein